MSPATRIPRRVHYRPSAAAYLLAATAAAEGTIVDARTCERALVLGADAIRTVSVRDAIVRASRSTGIALGGRA